MTYTILSAQYVNPEQTAAVCITTEAGAVAVSKADRPELWEMLKESGVKISPWSRPVENVLVPVGDFFRNALTSAERAKLFRASETDDSVADFLARLRTISHVSLGDDHSDPERQCIESMIDEIVKTSIITKKRKIEILKWRPKSV